MRLKTAFCIVGVTAVCALVAAPGRAQSAPKTAPDTFYPLAPAPATPKVVIDLSDNPDAKAWAIQAQTLAEQWFPVIWRMLGTEGVAPPKQIKLTFHKKLDVPAYEANNEISINGEWIAARPDDLGMIIHEMTHIVQSYPDGGDKPGWLVEGIADFVRWWRYEPETPRPKIDPLKNSYRDSYRITAAFLAWVTFKYDRGIVPKMDRALRNGTYSPELWKTATGKDVDTLWSEFAPLPAAPAIKPTP